MLPLLPASTRYPTLLLPHPSRNWDGSGGSRKRAYLWPLVVPSDGLPYVVRLLQAVSEWDEPIENRVICSIEYDPIPCDLVLHSDNQAGAGSLGGWLRYDGHPRAQHALCD